ASGRENSGIILTPPPTINGSSEIPRSIEERAAAIGSLLERLGRDFDWTRSPHGWNWQRGPMRLDDLPLPALAGAVQLDNAASVLACLACRSDRLALPRSAIESGRPTGR